MKDQKSVNSCFKKVKNKEKMVAWLMRQYFDPRLHAKKPWYKSSVSKKNVLKYISDPFNEFPLTPIKVAKLWRIIQSFKKNLRKAEEELGPNLGLPEKEVQKKIEEKAATKTLIKYQGGEVTLKEIGKVLGGVSPTMINKLALSGVQKFRALTKGETFEKISEKDSNAILKNIVLIRKETVGEYASNLKSSRGDIKHFVRYYLIKKQIMTTLDARLMEDKEIESLILLAGKSRKQIMDILLFDIGRQDNLFKSFQSAVSRKAFPLKDRGRPRKKE